MTDLELAWLVLPEWAGKDKYEQHAENSPDYGTILAWLGDVVVRVDEDDYQGSTFALLRARDGSGWIVSVFGWGSCSGCDALEACDGDLAAFGALAREMESEAQRFASLPEAIEYLDRAESAVRWYHDNEAFKKFRDAVGALGVPA